MSSESLAGPGEGKLGEGEFREGTSRRQIGLKRSWPEQVGPVQANLVYSGLAQSGIGLKRFGLSRSRPSLGPLLPEPPNISLLFLSGGLLMEMWHGSQPWTPSGPWLWLVACGLWLVACGVVCCGALCVLWCVVYVCCVCCVLCLLTALWCTTLAASVSASGHVPLRFHTLVLICAPTPSLSR